MEEVRRIVPGFRGSSEGEKKGPARDLYQDTHEGERVNELLRHIHEVELVKDLLRRIHEEERVRDLLHRIHGEEWVKDPSRHTHRHMHDAEQVMDLCPRIHGEEPAKELSIRNHEVVREMGPLIRSRGAVLGMELLTHSREVEREMDPLSRRIQEGWLVKGFGSHNHEMELVMEPWSHDCVAGLVKELSQPREYFGRRRRSSLAVFGLWALLEGPRVVLQLCNGGPWRMLQRAFGTSWTWWERYSGACFQQEGLRISSSVGNLEEELRQSWTEKSRLFFGRGRVCPPTTIHRQRLDTRLSRPR